MERHWTDAEGVKRFALRKPPVVSGPIRVVEIPDWDASACGGTHTKHTGEVGIVKIVRWEKVRGNFRFEFLCGGRALRDHAWRTEALLEAAKKRTLKDRELLALTRGKGGGSPDLVQSSAADAAAAQAAWRWAAGMLEARAEA